ncbi:MAG: 50S ribosomal protein L40e [Candidatus Diapherotrites archaeon CG11_big_fil_rev_8_21_14_0_20_37_9]|nr:MAG: 50S ribosomal protein L40e [Candidatus Diapherotrites archaeon CG11_big_fil_rev_8_21_14_0_20_37_9]
MALATAAAKRLFENIWICMSCSAKNRGNNGKKPGKCRKCGTNDFRLKKKGKKKAG